MRFATGARLGPYQLLGPLGAGGMGEVYKARDTRLDRTVAVKVLSERLAVDHARRARFEREMRAVAALNHPHICVVHDVGEAEPASTDSVPAPIPFLVMEYLEGQTLAERLLRGPLSAAEVLRYAIELADALDHAHRHGLVHRDLKPGNVMLTKAGAKLLDFGLSKLQPCPDLIGLSTLSPGGEPLTSEGAVLGTFPYMAPEQLAGREADARSDIFAFGALLYEMATGRRAFEGSTAATVIGAVLHTDPPAPSSVQPLALPALDRIVARCLGKDPDDRWQTARDLLLELKWIVAHPTTPLAPQARHHDKTAALMVGVAMAAVAVTAAAFAIARGDNAADTAPIRLPFSAPDGLTLADAAISGSVTISPDGERVAFVVMSSGGRRGLWIRELDTLSAQPLAGTDGALDPFWSPDSQSIGFFAQAKLKKVRVSGGPPQVLCDALVPTGGTWNHDGVILFSTGAGLQLAQVSAAGGMPAFLPADTINEERSRPHFLPDGRHFVYYGRPQKWGIYVASIDSPQATRFLVEGVGAAYANGHLLVLRGAGRGSEAATLWAQPFDASSLQFTSEASAIAERVAYQSGRASSSFSVSGNGRLIYGSFKSLETQLIWFDRSGKPLGNVGGPVRYLRPSLSPDGDTIAATRVDPDTEQDDLWLIETARGIASRFTSYPNFEDMPVWSPDGSRIIFTSPRNTRPNLYQKALSGGAEELLIRSDFNDQPNDWSRDGRFLLYQRLHPKTQWDLWYLPMSDEADRRPMAFLESNFNERLARFSPDGRWLAYTSDESGRDEVHLRSFPRGDVQRQISANGGSAPNWRGDGRELFYLEPGGNLMAVNMAPGTTVEAGPPKTLFLTRISAVGEYPGSGRNYTVAPDGQRFLISTVTEEHRSIPTTILLDWPAVLGRR